MKTNGYAAGYGALLLGSFVLAASSLSVLGDVTNDPVVMGAMSILPNSTNTVGLNDHLIVQVDNLSNLVAQAAQEHRQIVLYLDGFELPGLYPESVDSLKNELRFQLQRTDSTQQAWTALLGCPKHFVRAITVSVGLEKAYPIATDVQGRNRINFVVIRQGWFWGCLISTSLLILGVVKLATRTNALRDDGPATPDGQLRTYSLARCQMAFWFVLVLPTFVYLWLITGALDTLTTSVLVLMGVSAGTAVFAHAQGIQGGTSPASAGLIKGFVKDALKDDEGSVSFHHFQMFVWTFVLGCIFVVEVWRNLAMPEFSATLLGMMGISSGTYLGFMLKNQ